MAHKNGGTSPPFFFIELNRLLVLFPNNYIRLFRARRGIEE
jgi:hypothetical protein